MSDLEFSRAALEELAKIAEETGAFFKPRLAEQNTITDIGTAGNSSGIIAVPGRGGFIYVTIQRAGYSGDKPIGREVLEVWNPSNFVPAWGQEVRIGYTPQHPRKKQVLSVNYEQYGDVDDYRDPETPDEPPPTYIDDSVEKRRIKQLHAHRGSTAFAINVYREELDTALNEMIEFETQEIDLAAEVPESGERIVTIWIDPNHASGPLLSYTAGDPYTAVDLSGNPVELSPLSQRAPNVEVGYYRIAWVRLFAGQSEIDDRLDIHDGRQLYTPVGGGTGGRAQRVGEVLFSVDGQTFTRQLPLTSMKDGWLVGGDGILMV